ncbi:hypothetical protein MKW98_008228 [Papaver atlanticum]|uniref:Uncharacterized protein n=1 Tax=Papaver atlanticum TaxID=357466 RepID=A0AAD4RW25_9MAGN|nr:hypothetical protein MKW98_008228 [Papaver atlanticum]
MSWEKFCKLAEKVLGWDHETTELEFCCATEEVESVHGHGIDLSRNPVDGLSAGLVGDKNVFEPSVTIIGPPDTLYVARVCYLFSMLLVMILRAMSLQVHDGQRFMKCVYYLSSIWMTRT